MNPPAAQLLNPASTTTPPAISRLAALEWPLIAFALLAIYFLLQENGTLLPTHAAQYLHELTHDARHALGTPCH